MIREGQYESFRWPKAEIELCEIHNVKWQLPASFNVRFGGGELFLIQRNSPDDQFVGLQQGESPSPTCL